MTVKFTNRCHPPESATEEHLAIEYMGQVPEDLDLIL